MVYDHMKNVLITLLIFKEMNIVTSMCYFFFVVVKFIYLFIYGCVGSPLLPMDFL